MSAGRLPGERYDSRLPVLILKTGARPLNHGTLGVIRSLGRAGIPVYCSKEPQADPPARSRYLSGAPIGILAVEDEPSAVLELKDFQKRLGRPLTIIPVDDRGALFLAENAAALGENIRLPHQPPGLPRRAGCKADLPQLCAVTRTPTPATVAVRPNDDLAAVTSAMGYPAMVKIAQPWLLPDGVRPALLVRSQAEALQYRSRLAVRGHVTMVVQEYVPHEAAEDWFYHGYHFAGGEAAVGFTGRKLRSFPAFVGATSYGVSLVNHEVRSLAQSLLRQIGYAGIVELEFRFDKRDGQYKLIDFNPRPGAQFQFLRNTLGVDVVRAFHLDLSGRPIPDAPQLEGRAFVSEFTDAAAFGAYRRRGLISPGAWLKQYFAADRHAWFALDDMAPFAAAGFSFGKDYIRRRWPGRSRDGRRPAPVASGEPLQPPPAVL